MGGASVYPGWALRQVPVDEAPRDAELAGQPRQLAVPGVPARLGDLVRLQAELTASVVGGKADHQRMRKRPRLAAKVADVAEIDADFLVNFARDGFLER